jgi:hypothetical protein
MGMFMLACLVTSPLSGTATPGAASSTQATADVHKAPVPLEPIIAQQGELIRDGDIRLMVHGWGELGPTLPKQPAMGKKYIAVDFSVVNAGSKCKELFGLHGSRGTADFAVNNELIEHGTICPGEKVRHTIIYEVSASAVPYLFQYANDRLPELAPVTVKLSEAPGIVEPPSNIEGEEAPVVETADKPITRGNWQIQVAGVKVHQPCKLREGQRSSLNCTIYPNDILDIRLDIIQKNISPKTEVVLGSGMFWLQDSTGHRFYSIGLTEKSVGSGEEIRFSVDFLVWPDTQDLWLAFRDGSGESMASHDYVCISLPDMVVP